MKEAFGTNSLITDYGPLPSSPPETIETVLKELEEILATPYSEMTKPQESPKDPDKFIDEIIDFGFNSGVRHLAERLYPKLKNLQNNNESNL
jgi:hypothetical protein